MGSGFSEPSPRWAHFSTAVEGKVYAYGGRTKGFKGERNHLASTVHLFNPCQESWQERRPEGTPPPGFQSGACASAGHHAYFYGGVYGTEVHGSLHQLNTNTLTWSTLTTTGRLKTIFTVIVAYAIFTLEEESDCLLNLHVRSYSQAIICTISG